MKVKLSEETKNTVKQAVIKTIIETIIEETSVHAFNFSQFKEIAEFTSEEIFACLAELHFFDESGLPFHAKTEGLSEQVFARLSYRGGRDISDIAWGLRSVYECGFDEIITILKCEASATDLNVLDALMSEGMGLKEHLDEIVSLMIPKIDIDRRTVSEIYEAEYSYSEIAKAFSLNGWSPDKIIEDFTKNWVSEDDIAEAMRPLGMANA